MNAAHLHAVQPSTDASIGGNTEAAIAPPGGTGSDGATAERARRGVRSQRALPTDRMEFETQVQVLKAYAIASRNGREIVTGEDLARHVSVGEDTARLNNRFLAESGLIVAEQRGAYKPVEAVLEFSRKLGFGQPNPGHTLASVVRNTWYFEAVTDRLEMGPPSRNELIMALADVAGAEAHHRRKLDNIIDWLEYVGLVSIVDDTVRLGDVEQADASRDVADADGRAAGDTLESGASPHAERPIVPPPVPVPAAAPAAADPDPMVLSINVSLNLSRDSVSALTTEQLNTLLKGVGAVAQIKASAGL
jgi:hypothetical protein